MQTLLPNNLKEERENIHEFFFGNKLSTTLTPQLSSDTLACSKTLSLSEDLKA
jgi:hypothetical protein